MREHLPTIERIMANRARRAMVLSPEIAREPHWAMLLDLAQAQAVGKSISVTSLCIASEVPHTTALRKIDELEQAGLIERTPMPHDGRGSIMSLTRSGQARMARYLATVAGQAT